MTDYLYPQFIALRPWLIALALLHLALFVQQWAWQRRYFAAQASSRYGPALSLPRLLLKWALWSAAGWMLLTALAVPQGPPVKVEGEQRGADLVLCVDVSSSMLAQDIQPNRLTALKAALGDLLGRLDGDRVGLVAFAGDAVVACPLTTDLDTVSLFLDKLDIDSVPRDGTGLGPALQSALDDFKSEGSRGKLILLATDGEDTDNSDAMLQAKRAADAGVPIYTLGIGTAAGALIPGRTDIFGRTFAKTWHGQPVRTKLDSSGLKKIAALTGGEYFEAGDRGGMARAAERVSKLKQGLAKAQDRIVREPLFETPLLWAFFLLLAESLLSARAGGWRAWGPGAKRLWRRWWHPNAGKALGALLLLALLPAWASASARTDFNDGNKAYRAGDYGQAVERYAEVAQADPKAGDAPYNLGLALARLGRIQEAATAMQEAVRRAPDDPKAQKNLETLLKLLPKDQAPSGDPGAFDKLGDKARNGLLSKPAQPGSGQPGKPDISPRSPAAQGPAGSLFKPPSPPPGSRISAEGNRPGPDPEAQHQGRDTRAGGTAQAGPGPAGGPKPGAANALNQDKVQAMMNQLRLDQQRYKGAFNPLKHYDRKDKQSDDPMEQMMQEMGLKVRPQGQQQGPANNDEKDW